jgi:hypothetical protein
MLEKMDLLDGRKMINDIKLNVLQYIKDNHKFIICLLIVLAVLGIGYYEYKHYKPVPMANVSKNNTDEIAKALSGLHIQATPHETKEIVQTIERRVQSPPDIVYITTSQVQADQEANKLAKDDKSDVVIKQQEKKADGQVVNEYFGIHMQKNNQIAIGVSVVDSKAYATLAVQHEKVIVEVHSKDFKSIQGATVLYTIKQF